MSRPTARGRSRLRDLPLLLWLTAAIVIAVAHRWLPDANWLMLHLVLVGAVFGLLPFLITAVAFPAALHREPWRFFALAPLALVPLTS